MTTVFLYGAGAMLAVDALVLWGPIIALVAAVLTAVIAGRVQLSAVNKTAATNESSILLTGYNQLVAALQQQVSEVQKDYNDLRERAIKAEASAMEASVALRAAKADFSRQISELTVKHDRELAILHAEMASLRNPQGETPK